MSEHLPVSQCIPTRDFIMATKYPIVVLYNASKFLNQFIEYLKVILKCWPLQTIMTQMTFLTNASLTAFVFFPLYKSLKVE